MNWTEGTLARHSRRKGWNKDAARQTEHFAKARARQRHLSDNLVKPPFVPDYIPRSHPVEHKSPSPVAPHPEPSTPNKRPISRRNRDPVPTKSLATLSSSSRPEGVNSLHPSNLDPAQDRRGDDIEAKRRRLLEKSDWTGMSFQKPVLVSSSKARTSRSVPRRKPPQSPEFARNQKNFVDKVIGGSRNDLDMTMRIGQHGLRWSGASNSVRSLPTNRDHLPALKGMGSTGGLSQSSLLRRPAQNTPSVAGHHERLPPRSFLHPRQAENSTPRSDCSSSTCSSRYRGNSPDRPRQIVQCSTPLLAPQPTRASSILYSPAFDEDSSVVAQVGVSKRPPSEAIRENAQWRDWLNLHDSSEAGFSDDPKIPRPQKRDEAETRSPALRSTPTRPSNVSSAVLVQHEREPEAGPPNLPREEEPHEPKATTLSHDQTQIASQPRIYVGLGSNYELEMPPKVQDLVEILEDKEQTKGQSNYIPEDVPEDEDKR